ncbi:aquaporin [uncultured Bifidobacterium sp.]|uniref:MIP/aquaporin family protein n=1 Tax=uncultured Bifidobacterium sp. TaxID=165187 RepID=UPI0028DC0854|nr:aquaporin [uncultured Bifidobacterium sp.]
MSNRTAVGLPSVATPLALRAGAELVGSLFVFLAIYMVSSYGTAMYGVNMAFIAVATGLAYAAVTTVMGKLSGGHYNPAVTVAAMLTGRTAPLDGLIYIVAQILGSLGAGALLRFLLPTSSSVKASVWLTPVVNGFDDGSVSYSTLSSVNISFSIGLAVLVEVVGSMIVIAAALRTLRQDGSPTEDHGLVMGMAYGLGAAVAYPLTGAGLNPARSTGIAVFAQNQGLSQQPLQQLWVFWICPVLAAALVALVVIVAQMLSGRATGPVAQDAADAEDDDDETDSDASDDDPDAQEDEQQTESEEDADSRVESD